MSYRFVKVTTFYSNYLAHVYARQPLLSHQSYAEQYATLMADAFGWSDYFARHLRKLGVEAHEIICNAEALQKAWAREQGITTHADWLKHIVLAQLKVLQPEVVLFQDCCVFYGDWINNLRERIPSIKNVIGFYPIMLPKKMKEQLQVFDFMIACTPHYVEDLQRSGITGYLIKHAFEPSVLELLKNDTSFPPADIISIGSLSHYHSIRKHVIEQLLRAGIGVHVYADAPGLSYKRLIAMQGAYLLANMLRTIKCERLAKSLSPLEKALLWEHFPTRASHFSARLKAVLRPPIYGRAAFCALSRAKIGLNVHIDSSFTMAGNVRQFEVTGMGICMLTDWKENLATIFEPEKEVVTFKSAEECVEKARWLLAHPREREAIARAGQARTLRDHTFERRAVRLDEIIRIHLGNKVKQETVSSAM